MTGPATSNLVHGTTVALNGHGVLIRGAPGSGKSDVALRLLDAPGTGGIGLAMQARLIADDQTILTLTDGKLVATAPPALAGKLELRGFGIVTMPCAPAAPLALVVDLMPAALIVRMPETHELTMDLFGLRLTRCCIDAQQPSAVARIRCVLQAVLAGHDLT